MVKRTRNSINVSAIAVFVAAVLGVLSEKAVAHHSFAQRVAGEIQSLEFYDGVIDLYRMLNPHSALFLTLDNEDGTTSEWLIELSSASTLSREGWTPELLHTGDKVSISILASRTANRGRLRALLVRGETEADDSRLIVAYGIRGDTPIMRRLRERLPTCEGIEGTLDRGACFDVTPEALADLESEFPGTMGYVMP
ncbi:MAG: DUF6152 family protein [Candidatus Rariloculaceae bacterium]